MESALNKNTKKNMNVYHSNKKKTKNDKEIHRSH